tara:strand:- start:27 stop:800 length:774 start_codon:yes stop_codon:yes gene_type:complete
MSRVFLGGLVILVAVLVFAVLGDESETDSSPKEIVTETAATTPGTATSIPMKPSTPGNKAGEERPTTQRASSSEPKDKGKRGPQKAVEPEAAKIPKPSPRLKRPYNVANDALEALKNGDFESLLLLVPPAALESVRERWGKGTERHIDLFGPQGWQQQSLQEWTGELLSVRVKRNVQALVKYGETIEDGVTKHLCVSLLNIDGDGNWYFKDLDARPDESFLDYGEAVGVDFVSPPLPANEVAQPSEGTVADEPPTTE